ncbi:MAG: DUF1573 domain-containing protein [Bacteroidetes bacterium]|nr:DUF1573 domain-containing protein [Bacteroidota bacterium]
MKLSFLLLLVFPLFTSAQINIQSKETKPEIKFEEYEYNFGTVTEDTVIIHEYVFSNTTRTPLIVTDTHGTCHCIVTEFSEVPLAKNQKGKIKVSFDTKGRVGKQEKTVTVNSTAKTGQVILYLKGEVKAKN